MQRPRHSLDVERIDDYGIGELFGRSREPGQHQHAGVTGLRRDKLLGDQVHAVSQRCHHVHIRVAIESRETVLAKSPVKVSDRDPLAVRVPAVYAAHQTLDRLSLPDVLGHASPGRIRYLDERDPSVHVPVLVQHPGECLEPVWYALGVV